MPYPFDFIFGLWLLLRFLEVICFLLRESVNGTIKIRIAKEKAQRELTPPSTLPNLISKWCRSKNCTCPRVKQM